MEMTRNIILDLLPLYLADEVSEETRIMIETYLQEDPDLARLVKKSANLQFHQPEIEMPLPEKGEKHVYKSVKRLRWQHNLFLALAVGSTTLFTVFGAFMAADRKTAVLIFFILSVAFWAIFFRVNKRIDLQTPKPAPLTEEEELSRFKNVKRLKMQHNLFLLLSLVYTTLFTIFGAFRAQDEQLAVLIFLILAAAFWFAFFKTNKQLENFE